MDHFCILRKVLVDSLGKRAASMSQTKKKVFFVLKNLGLDPD